MSLLHIGIYSFFICLGLLLYSIAFSTTRKYGADSVNSFLTADKSVPYSLIASSVLVSWTWTLTIVGAAEAGMWYGITGGISYTFGAIIPFIIFIPLVIRLRKLMPNAITYTEFIGERYGSLTQNVYFVFAILVVMYIFIEQLVGVSLVFHNVFDFNFKITVFLIALIVTSCITIGGIRGAFNNNALLFTVICVIFGIIFFSISKNINIKFIYDGLTEAANNSQSPNYNPQILMLNSIAGLKYGIIAIVVAFGQVLLNQGYYSIATASNNDKNLRFGFLIGAMIAWMPIPIICANIFGHTAIALNLSTGRGINITTDIATYILMQYGGTNLAAAFALMISLIAICAGSNCLVGIQALFTADFYGKNIKEDATDKEKIKFGRIITVCFGSLCAFIAISLDGISLLRIDMFSGIFFAAPCGALIAGLYMKKTNGIIAIVSIFTGIFTGIAIWIYGDPAESWMYACMVSLILPAFIILISSKFIKNNFNFSKLQFYKIKP